MQEVMEADVVICTVDIIESTGYTANLSKKSGLCAMGIVDSEFMNGANLNAFLIPELPKAMGYAERPAAKGVWIPVTSRDPYGMGSTTEVKVRCKCLGKPACMDFFI